jgi:ribosomal protein S18 acetylase RimI-like enzyme
MTAANDPVDLGIRQFCDAWTVLSASVPSPITGTGEGLKFIFSGLPVAFFNAAIVTERDVSAGALAAAGREACAWAADKRVPYLFVVTHEALVGGVDAPSVLAGCGMAPVMPLTGMIAHRIVPALRRPEDLQLVVPDDEEGCAALLDVNAGAYGMDLEAGKPALGRPEFWRSQHVPVLGIAGGKPVSASAVWMVDGYRYVALVATDPSCQRRGYAEATMRHSLEVAAEQHGDRPSVLHATDAGRPIYARMGYDEISHHTVFMEQRFLEGH